MPYIPQVKIGNTTYKMKDQDAWDHMIEGSTTQPTHPANKIWVNESAAASTEVQVPTYEEFSDLKDAYEYVNKSLDNIEKIPVYPGWKQGSLSGAGSETDSNIRIRTIFIPVENFDDVVVQCDTGWLYELYRYNSSKTFIDSISWNNTARHVNLTGCAYIRFILCQSGNPPIVPSSGEHLHIWGYTAAYTWKKVIEENYLHYGGYITSSTMSTILTDANNAELNVYYTIRFTSNETNILPNLPFDHTEQGKTDMLWLATFPAGAYKYQVLYSRDANIWARLGVVNGNSWFSWTKNGETTDTGRTIHVGAGQEFTKLTDAIKYAYDNYNTTVIVHPGTYNIITEMGADYWANFSYNGDYSAITHGKLGHGSHFIFSPDALVTCEYTGNNTAVNQYYAPFNSLWSEAEGDFTLEGLTLVVSGCRYAIHDDVGASTVEQTHRYINCDITNDKRCIGAGLGADMTVEMRDCVFRSSAVTAGNNPVSWHNSGGGTTGKCSIVMMGCYITGEGNNTVQFLYHGTTTKKTRVVVSNNSFTAAPVVNKAEPADAVNNIELIAWNNEIRQ